MRRLNELNQRLIGPISLEQALKEILTLAIEFSEADRGNIQLFMANTNSLHIAAHQGHSLAFLDHFKYQGCDAVCEAALRAKQRVIIDDILLAPSLQGTMDQKMISADGIRAVQSTPLVTRRGDVIGMISTHFPEPHLSTPEQFRFLDLLAFFAAETIERTKAENALRESEQKLREFNNTLERQVKDRTAELRLLEEKRQQEIFWAIVDTQEIERKRIAENLHNSLGQILYGARLGLSQVLQSELFAADKENLKNVDKLLNAAITESRRISHELIPVVLEDFGLKTAVEDICRQYSDRIKFRYRFTGLNKRLDKYIEIAIYRIVQELVMNIVKHSGAKEAMVAVEIKKAHLLVLVQDTGDGFDAEKENGNGIGLKTIRNRVKLLNGNINMVSNAGQGTVTNIDIPIVTDI
ncbi:MAG: GAF domain-containing sensor histidine kinase [Bacteroidetes bacterium]|nr:GAF domain-containing sensor histidine kinase [Bacteroidota bacterium]